MANYHVTQLKDKNWKALREGAKRAAVIVSTQTKAEKIAKKLSHTSGGGEVVIHRPNVKKNLIRDKDTVKPGHESKKKDTKH